MFEIFRNGIRVMSSPVEGGGYTKETLSGMLKAGYVFQWERKRWKPEKPGIKTEYEQKSLLN